MIQRGDVVGFRKSMGFRSVVLENVLGVFSERAGNELHSLKASDIGGSQSAMPDCSLKGNKLRKENSSINKFSNIRGAGTERFRGRDKSYLSIPVRDLEQSNFKIAIPETSESEAKEIINEIIKSKIDEKKHKPVVGNVIKPLYLFLDCEVLLYAKLKGLRFKEINKKGDNIDKFILEMGKKHPELYHAIVNSYLELYN